MTGCRSVDNKARFFASEKMNLGTEMEQKGKEEEIEMRVDEEMDEFAEENFGGQEIHFDYEFDAPQIFNFTHPETERESIQAQRWFETASGYPPSPIMVKLRWLKNMLMERLESSESHRDSLRTMNDDGDDESVISMDSQVSNPGDSRIGLEVGHNPVQNASKVKRKPVVRSSGGCRSSTLMKPTASHLAKQRKPRETNERFPRRC